MLVIKQVFLQLHVHWLRILWGIVNIDPEVLVNKSFVLVNSIKLFCNYDVVYIIFITVGFVNEAFLYVSHTIGVLSNNLKLEFSQYLTIIHRSGGKYPPLSPTLK